MNTTQHNFTFFFVFFDLCDTFCLIHFVQYLLRISLMKLDKASLLVYVNFSTYCVVHINVVYVLCRNLTLLASISFYIFFWFCVKDAKFQSTQFSCSSFLLVKSSKFLKLFKFNDKKILSPFDYLSSSFTLELAMQ